MRRSPRPRQAALGFHDFRPLSRRNGNRASAPFSCRNAPAATSATPATASTDDTCPNALSALSTLETVFWFSRGADDGDDTGVAGGGRVAGHYDLTAACGSARDEGQFGLAPRSRRRQRPGPMTMTVVEGVLSARLESPCAVRRSRRAPGQIGRLSLAEQDVRQQGTTELSGVADLGQGAPDRMDQPVARARCRCRALVGVILRDLDLTTALPPRTPW